MNGKSTNPFALSSLSKGSDRITTQSRGIKVAHSSGTTLTLALSQWERELGTDSSIEICSVLLMGRGLCLIELYSLVPWPLPLPV
jgi:hypothetical protein